MAKVNAFVHAFLRIAACLAIQESFKIIYIELKVTTIV